jgi:lipoprotein-anchoring transpeptidase ErfK/SrfK
VPSIRLVAWFIAATTALAAAFVGAGISLREFGPDTSWNVFAPASTATATATPTPTATPTSKPSATPSPSATPTSTPVPPSPVPPPNPPPIPGPDVSGERWILVDLASQTATAMIGDAPLYTALVTTGKDGWETPRGEWAIVSRVENETMTSASIGAEEYYVLTDVLYTQYFTTRGHALHLNYWRPDSYFGRVRSSHGCVGMRLADAEFFWKFATIGTRVVVR